MDSERFDILAQAPDGSAHRHLSPMLQALLGDRFKLALHREIRETTMYALALAKNGPKLERSALKAQYSIEMRPASRETLI